MEISKLKISELSRLSDIDKTIISKLLKGKNEQEVLRNNNRIVGISPNSVSSFLDSYEINYYQKGAVILSANLCGGVGKTSGIHSLGICARRITDEKDPIVMVDTDSQGSFTSSIFSNPAGDEELILIDFLEGKASIKDILTSVGNNIWFVKSNLNQAYIDKVLSKPIDIKKGMLKFYNEIFNYLGDKTKIFQDHTPQLSSVFASSVCALSQLSDDILKSVIIPMRSDNYAIDGASKILSEIRELQETFNLDKNVSIHCFFSSIDKRISTTSEAIKASQKRSDIIEHLSPVVVRYCSEIPKSILKGTNIYSTGKNNKAAEDYQDLLKSIFSNNVAA